MVIYNKTRQLLFVSVDRQTFWGLEMTSNSRDTFNVGKLIPFKASWDSVLESQQQFVKFGGVVNNSWKESKRIKTVSVE